MMIFGIGALAAAALYAGWTLGGGRGLAAVAAVIALAWLAERVDSSWRAEAALAQTKADLTAAHEALNDLVKQSNKAAAAAAAKIAAHELARNEAEQALDRFRQTSAAEFASLKNRIAAHVPSRPQCDYPQPVLDGLRDAYTRASR